MTTGLGRVALAPSSAALQSAASVIGNTPFDWSRAPSTRARVFAERLTDVRPVCVMGRRNDSENCLLDLPPDVNVEVRASRLMLAGCEASLPAPVREALLHEGRDTHRLDQTFSEIFAAESQGKFSVPAIELRLTERLLEMSPNMQRMLRDAGAYIEVPQLTFLRVLTSEEEARRHGVTGPLPNRHFRRSAGDPQVHDAMLGAYIRAPVNGRVHTLLVSLATPGTVELIAQDALAHAREHRHYLFGEVPEFYRTTRLQMRAIGPGKRIEHTLARWLHEGHRRYLAFASGETRETLAPESHRHIRQRPCQPDAPAQTIASAETPPQAPPLPEVTGRASRLPRAKTASMAEMEKAFAELMRLDRYYTKLSRSRFG